MITSIDKRIVWLLVWPVLAAQSQVSQTDFRQQTNLRFEHRLNQNFAVSGMAAAVLTNDFHEIGFAYADAGFSYRLTRHWSVNANYRLLMRRNLRNYYVPRHVVYADLDYQKSLRRHLGIYGTARVQNTNFDQYWGDSGRTPSIYLRTRAGLRYRFNYYWHTFAENEWFTPLLDTRHRLPDQYRVLLGFGYTFNRFYRVEIYEQLQREIHVAAPNTFWLLAVNWGIRF